MGKLNCFEIILDHPMAVYLAGATITGRVIVDLNEPMKMRGIFVKFSGGANVHWTERHSSGSGKNRKTVTRHYNASESYFDINVAVFGNAGGDHPIHPAGRYEYPVQMQLPLQLPSSFEGAWGRVRYCLQGTIDKPWKFDHHCKRAFTVLSILDLNTQANVLQSQQGNAEKTLCCLCCASGPISATLTVDRRGYVPGEFVSVNGEVINNSRRKMCSSKIELRMVTQFHARSKTRSSRSTVTSLTKGEISSGDTEIWRGERLHLPPLPPSALVYCNIIDITYYIVMVVDPSGPAFDLEVPLEIVIGTIPLRNIQATYSAAPPTLPAIMPMPTPDDGNIPSAAHYNPPQPYNPTPDAPPPSYSECVFGNVNIRDEEKDNQYMRGDLEYTPRYTYYNWKQPAVPSAPLA